MRSYENILHLLTALNLKGIENSLDEILTDAEVKKESNISLFRAGAL